MSKHTPGPWKIDPFTKVLTAGPRGLHLGTLDEAPGLGTSASANRRLIAAAPALLDALRAAERSLTWHLEQKGRAVNDDTEILAAVRAAIAQAEGRQ